MAAVSLSLSIVIALGVLVPLVLSLALWNVKQKEKLQRLTEARIKASETRFRTLLDSAPDAIIMVNSAGVISMVNSQTEKWFGYTREQLLGQKIEILIPSRFHQVHVNHRTLYAETPTTRPMGGDAELYGLRKDGSEFPVEISLSPAQIDGELWITSIVRDISARKQQDIRIKNLNHDLSQRSVELETINRELESFSYSVSHDLRAPLRAMDGFSSTLLKDYGDRLDERGRDRLRRIRAACQRMATLIDDLLNLSRVSRTDLQWQPLDLSSIAQDVVDTLREEEPERQVQVDITPNMQLSGDPRLLTIAINNLLRNAWKFTSHNPHAQIAVGFLQQPDGQLYFVRDNGAGFDMQFANKLFGAFQRLHDANEFPGTGVGLATVQRIVHKHGGRIWAQSAVNEGATFFFTLNSIGYPYSTAPTTAPTTLSQQTVTHE